VEHSNTSFNLILENEKTHRLSVVIPFYNEAELVSEVLLEVRGILPEAEIIAVDDGSTDGTGRIIGGLHDIRLISLRKNCGQSAAMYAGLRAARGELIAMMDGDGQNDPAEIPKLVEAMASADVVFGVRSNRQDSKSRLIASKVANAIRRLALGDNATDTGCSLKVIRREHVSYLVPFNGLHRYLPAFLQRAGLRSVEVPVNHRSRKAGVSKYTIQGRAIRGIYDLIGVRWLLNRRIVWPADQIP
jgi:dolichol-phosphate mannosyltransferase